MSNSVRLPVSGWFYKRTNKLQRRFVHNGKRYVFVLLCTQNATGMKVQRPIRFLNILHIFDIILIARTMDYFIYV